MSKGSKIAAVTVSTGNSSVFDEIIDFMVCKLLFSISGKQWCKVLLCEKHPMKDIHQTRERNLASF